jgi:hypothetical protein
MIEYKVLCTTASGVPLGKGDEYHTRLQDGLNRLGEEGWNLCDISGTLMIFNRKLRNESVIDTISEDRLIQPQ